MTAIAACRTCGTEPLENARFCHGCGSPVQHGDIHAEYKQVTLLFADVVHSMNGDQGMWLAWASDGNGGKVAADLH